MSNNKLEHLQAKGIRWNTILSVLTFLFQLIILYFLNKLISPDEFGKAIFALASFMILFSFVNLSFDRVGIRSKELGQKDYSAIFYFSLIVNGLLFLIFFFGVANLNFNASAYAKPYIKIFSIIFLINILKVIPVTMLHRNLMFDRISVITFISKVIALLTALFFTFQKQYFEALVSLYAGPLFLNALFSMFAIKWTIPKYQSLSYVQENFGMAASFSFHKLLVTVSNNIDALMVGEFFGEQPIAEWRKSMGFQNLPLVHVVNPIAQVLYPTFSKVQDSVQSLSRFFFRTQNLIAFILLPSFLLLFTLARPFASIYFSEGENVWNISRIASLLQIFSITGIVAMFNPLFYSFFQVTSSRKSINQIVVSQRVIFLLLIFATFKFGLIFLAIGRFVSEIIALGINAFFAKKYFLKTDFYPTLRNILTVLLISIGACFVGYFFFYNLLDFLSPIPKFLTASVIAAALYLLFSFFLNRKGFQIFKETFLSKKPQ